MAASRPSSIAKPTLHRGVGLFDLTALGINQVIGGAIFLIPAPIAAQIGGWSPVGFAAAGLAMMLIALCYAETGSRFTETGGAYLYSRAAFGKFIGFEVGWMQWFVRVSSQAAIVSGIAAAISYYWAGANRGWGRAMIVSTITLLIGYLHTRGIRESAMAIRFFTVGKLAPLLVFIVAGLSFADWSALPPFPAVSPNQALTAGFMLAFAFGGFETIPVVCGEAKNPRRDVVYALISTLVCVTIVMSLAQLVYIASSRGITDSATPLADSAGLLMGWVGAAMIGAGSLISMFGSNVGGSLAASRMLFAFAENGDSPEAFASIHSRYRTPHVAIWSSIAVALFLALTGSFVVMVGVSALARLVTYTAVALATIRLRRPDSPPAAFVLPFGAAIPVAATAISLAMIAGATRDQLVAGALALAAGALLFGGNQWTRMRTGRRAAARAGIAG